MGILVGKPRRFEIRAGLTIFQIAVPDPRRRTLYVAQSFANENLLIAGSNANQNIVFRFNAGGFVDVCVLRYRDVSPLVWSGFWLSKPLLNSDPVTMLEVFELE